ncbi:hypothetical protein [Haloferula sp.]|uniref:hypothetical protein n=1 Tax=Haloferula sp. TaxID=2497595 RepID=UPI00329ABE4F
MKSSRLIKLALVTAAAAVFSSCYYDPSYGGYGSSYGVSGVSASFVSTSSDYWFYDPSVRCYYDRRRSCYYDPYLYGYYPRGYTPRPISNCPHPYGYSGRGRAPVPNGVNGRTLTNHQNRVAQLQARNYKWAQQVQVRNDANLARWQHNRATAAANYQGHQNTQPRNQGSQNQPQRSNGPRYGDQRTQAQKNLDRRAAQNHYKREAIIADVRAKSQASVEAVRARNAEIRAKAAQNQAALRQRAADNQAQRASKVRAAQEAQQQRLQQSRNRRSVN